jgi:hypothetical protein
MLLSGIQTKLALDPRLKRFGGDAWDKISSLVFFSLSVCVWCSVNDLNGLNALNRLNFFKSFKHMSLFQEPASGGRRVCQSVALWYANAVFKTV